MTIPRRFLQKQPSYKPEKTKFQQIHSLLWLKYKQFKKHKIDNFVR